MNIVALAVYLAVYDPYTVQRCSVACVAKKPVNTPLNTPLKKTPNCVPSGVAKQTTPWTAGVPSRPASTATPYGGLFSDSSREAS